MSEARGTAAETRKQKYDSDNKEEVVSGTVSEKARDNDAASEEEVEEFFAILKRIHVAVGHFKREQRSSDGRKLTEEGSRVRSMLETEIVNGVTDGGDENIEEKLGLDLNSEPGPEV